MSKDLLGDRRHWLFVISFFFLSPAVHAQAVSAPGAGGMSSPALGGQRTLEDEAQAISKEKRDRVHLFVINGLDPAYLGNVNRLAAYYRSIGFANTTFHPMSASAKIRKQIEVARRSDPNARIVLLGFSLGANVARSLANSFQREGVHLECLIYLGGDTLTNTAESRPANVAKVLNITGHGYLMTGGNLTFRGSDIDGAENHRLDVRHLTLPSNAGAIHLISRAVLAVATEMPRAAAAPAASTERPVAGNEQTRRVP